MDDRRLSSIKVLFRSIFLFQDGCSANAGQHALEMSPGTSHSVCLSGFRLKDLHLSVSLSVSEWSLTILSNPLITVFHPPSCCSFYHNHHIRHKSRVPAIPLFIPLPLTFFIVHSLSLISP